MSERRQPALALTVLVGLAVIFAGWRVVSLGLADQFARKQPARALGWRPAHPLALAIAAEKSVERNPDHATKLALAALAANPREGRAFRVLGEVAELRGDTPTALKNYELASARSPRDLPTHFWLEQHYLSAGKLALALKQLDLLLRIEPETRDSQFALLQTLATLPQAHPELASLMAQRPPWRERFVTELCAQADDSAVIAPFLGRLRLAPGGLSDAELSAWLERLTKDHRWGEAYLNWASTLGIEQQSELGNLFNGDFEREPSNTGFDWRFGRVPGAHIERQPGAGVTGDFALRVSFEDRRVPFQHVQQLLVLTAGSYRLAGMARADGLRSERGLVWTVRCADTNQTLASTEPLTGRTAWRPFSSDFEVPVDACGGQWLQLSVPARIAAEQRIGGRAWFDGLRIVRKD